MVRYSFYTLLKNLYKKFEIKGQGSLYDGLNRPGSNAEREAAAVAETMKATLKSNESGVHFKDRSIDRVVNPFIYLVVDIF